MTNKKHPVDDIQEDIRNEAHVLKADAEELIHDVTEKAQHLEQEVEAYTKAAKQYITKNPLKSTAIAAFAGVLIGKLFGK